MQNNISVWRVTHYIVAGYSVGYTVDTKEQSELVLANGVAAVANKFPNAFRIEYIGSFSAEQLSDASSSFSGGAPCSVK